MCNNKKQNYPFVYSCEWKDHPTRNKTMLVSLTDKFLSISDVPSPWNSEFVAVFYFMCVSDTDGVAVAVGRSKGYYLVRNARIHVFKAFNAVLSG